MNKPVKPFSVAKEDFFHDALVLINGSGLPPAVIQYVLADIQRLVADASKEQYEKEVTEYRNELKKYENEMSSKEKSDPNEESKCKGNE